MQVKLIKYSRQKTIQYKHPILKGRNITRGIGRLHPDKAQTAVNELNFLRELAPERHEQVAPNRIGEISFYLYFEPIYGEKWSEEWERYRNTKTHDTAEAERHLLSLETMLDRMERKILLDFSELLRKFEAAFLPRGKIAALRPGLPGGITARVATLHHNTSAIRALVTTIVNRRKQHRTHNPEQLIITLKPKGSTDVLLANLEKYFRREKSLETLRRSKKGREFLDACGIE